MNINNNIPCEIYNCANMERTNTGYSESFIQEASRQLTAIIESAVGITGLCEKGYRICFFEGQKARYVYTGDIIFVRGYYHHRTGLFVDRAWICDLWVKWKFSKSVKKTHDDDINPGDITFSICTKLPLEVGNQLKLNYVPGSKFYECANWKKELKTVLYWRAHPITEVETAPETIKKEKSGLPFDYTIDCGWPDVTVRLCLINAKNEEIINKVDDTVSEFINSWNNKHDRDSEANVIHDSFVVENDDYKRDGIDDSRLISIFIDFGSSNPDTVLKKFLVYISKSGLELQNVIFS